MHYNKDKVAYGSVMVCYEDDQCMATVRMPAFGKKVLLYAVFHNVANTNCFAEREGTKHMMNRVIVIAALFYMYYHIGGLATTNILRLTSGNVLPILSSKCVCDSCGSPIGVFDQFPIVSFVVCKGKCKHCKAEIPVFPLVLEVIVIAGMIAITCFFRISYLGVILSFVYYEVIRVVVIAIKGRREDRFIQQYIIAVLIMFVYWIPTLWAAFLYTIV